MNKTLTQTTMLWIVAVAMSVIIPVVLWFVPPPFFKSSVVEIERGTTVAEAASILAETGVIYTPELITIPFLASDSSMVAGTYRFDIAVNASTVANRLATGEFGMPQKKVVIPEGFTNEQIADRLADQLDSDNFSREDFIQQAKDLEGYLYPDTYRLHSDVSTEEIITLMRDNFDEQISSLQAEIQSFDKSLSEIVKMASLIEREAADYEMRRRIAGVLWQRYDDNMALQVDAVFVPLLGKNTYELTRADLQVDSPYNLYQNQGLPPTAIANPGLDAIRATINPIESENIYYLSDKDGNFYFAKSLAEHNENKRRFLETNVN